MFTLAFENTTLSSNVAVCWWWINSCKGAWGGARSEKFVIFFTEKG